MPNILDFFERTFMLKAQHVYKIYPMSYKLVLLVEFSDDMLQWGYPSFNILITRTRS